MSDTTQNTQDVAPKGPTMDPRLEPFSHKDCDINDMIAAINLLKSDPSIVQVLAKVRSPGDLNLDFNKDGNVGANGVIAPTNREWGAALIAVAQLSNEQKKSPDKLEVQDVIDRGQCIYDELKAMEQKKKPAVCNVPKGRGQ